MSFAEGLTQIHQSFASTEYGQSLAAGIRFSGFKPEDMSNEEWEKTLGADVNNLRHMPLTLGLTKSLIKGLEEHRPGFLSAEDSMQLQVAALVHDEAESIIGDITYLKKTQQDKDDERELFHDFLTRFHPGLEPETHEFIRQSAENIVFSEIGHLAVTFNVIERLGYLRTGMIAHKRAENEPSSELRDGLRLLASEVTASQTGPLIGFAEDYLPIGHFLDHHLDIIPGILESMDRSMFDDFGRDYDEKLDFALANSRETLAEWRPETVALAQSIAI